VNRALQRWMASFLGYQRQGSREVAARSATAARVGQTVPCGYPALAAHEMANALDAPARKALTSDSPTHEPIGKAIPPEARGLEKSNFRPPQ